MRLYFREYSHETASYPTLFNYFVAEVAIIQKPYHVEICSANQWTGLYKIKTSVMKELLRDLSIYTGTYLGPYHASKMELFVKIIKDIHGQNTPIKKFKCLRKVGISILA